MTPEEWEAFLEEEDAYLEEHAKRREAEWDIYEALQEDAYP